MKWRHFRNEKSKIQADHQLTIIAQQFLFTSSPSSTKPYLETRNYTLIQLAADKGYASGGLALAQREKEESVQNGGDGPGNMAVSQQERHETRKFRLYR